MRLLDLPPEILQAIAKESVIALGPFKVQRLRLVNKLLSHQIQQATFATRIIDAHPSCFFEWMSISMKARHLETRTFTDPRGFNELTTVIQLTVNLLLREIKQYSDDLRIKYTRVLCAAAADFLEGIEILNQLKRVSTSKNHVSEDVQDVFAAAAHVGNVLLLEELIEKDVDIDGQSLYFGGALRGAASGGHREAVLLLLDRGADANVDSLPFLTNLRTQKIFYDHHTTALQAAALAGHEDIVKLLSDHVWVSTDHKRAILYAARGGHLCIVRFLLDHAWLQDRDRKEVHQWILLEACCYGHEPIVRMMLDLGINLNDPYRWAEDGYRWDGSVDKSPFRAATSHNPLRIATSRNFHKIVQLLLARGADPNRSEEFEDFTPLCDAVQHGNERIAQTLLDYGADISGRRCRNPLEVAVRRGALRMVYFLLERGADSKGQASNGETMLAAAAYRGYEPIVRILVKFGAGVDQLGKEPNPAMLCALRAGHDDVVKTLVELGAKKVDPL